WFRVGSRNEYTGITGVSHLLEHMLFNSSKNYKKGEITRLIRGKGGLENAATWTDFTYYWQLLSSEHLELSLKTLAERVGNALLLEPELEKERTVVLSELEGHENDPGWLLYHGLLATAFQAHPYQWPVIGWRSDVENITRQQLVRYYHTYYHPNNATLVLVGDFDSKKALALVRKYFSHKPPAALPKQPYTREPAQRGRREFNLTLAGSAARVLLGYHAPAMTDPDSYALMVLDQVLSGGRSSRLYQALVETGLATSAWSSADLRRDPGLFVLGATARQGIRCSEIEQALLKEVEKIKTEPVAQDELAAAKNQLEAYLVFQNDSVSDQGEQLGYYNTVANWRYLQTLIPRIKSVTPERLLAVARKYLTEENLTVARFVPSSGIASSANTATAAAAAKSSAETQLTPTSQLEQQPSGVVSDKLPLSAEAAPTKTHRHQAKPKDRSEPHRIVLANGIVVIVLENHANPTVAVAGNLKAGSYFDPQGKHGLARLTAEMITRGTNRRSALQIAREIDFVGASLETSCDVESMDFSAKCLTKDFPLILDILADVLRNPSFPQDQFEKAKSEMLSQLFQTKESPALQASRAFYNAAYPPGHPYHAPTIEEEAVDLRAIQRQDLLAFHRSYYRPDTMILVIVGDVDTEEAFDLVNRCFGDWSAEGPAPSVHIPAVSPPQKPTTISVPMADKSETAILFGHPLNLKRSDPDYYAVRVMNQILGGAGALASLLGQEVREKRGLAYDVYSTFEATLGPGPWYASLGTNPKDVDQAVKVLKETISLFKRKGPSKQQFEQAREFVIGVFPIALETNAGMARALLNAEFYGLGLQYLKNYAKIYRSVTLEQVKAAAAKYLTPENAILVTAGPVSSK
ncbi:MAG: pitrilysin family protein, partial [Armatimonadota bacterium]|nr:pitrilysin family protein [Armatimonadota bacterium]